MLDFAMPVGLCDSRNAESLILDAWLYGLVRLNRIYHAMILSLTKGEPSHKDNDVVGINEVCHSNEQRNDDTHCTVCAQITAQIR